MQSLCLLLLISTNLPQQADAPALLAALVDAEIKGPPALETLIAPIAARDPLRRRGWVSTLGLSGAVYIHASAAGEEKSTLRYAVAQLDWQGFVGRSGTGLERSGITMNEPSVPTVGAESFLCFDAAGIPQWQVSPERSVMLIADLDGDGRAAELLRYSIYYDWTQTPFVVVHDLTQRDLPPMLALGLDPGRKDRGVFDEAEVDITLAFEPAQEAMPARFVIRHRSGTSDEFAFDRQQRVWQVPEKKANPWWKPERDARRQLRFADYTVAEE